MWPFKKIFHHRIFLHHPPDLFHDPCWSIHIRDHWGLYYPMHCGLSKSISWVFQPLFTRFGSTSSWSFPTLSWRPSAILLSLLPFPVDRCNLWHPRNGFRHYCWQSSPSLSAGRFSWELLHEEPHFLSMLGEGLIFSDFDVQYLVVVLPTIFFSSSTYLFFLNGISFNHPNWAVLSSSLPWSNSSSWYTDAGITS